MKITELMTFQELRVKCGYKSARTLADALGLKASAVAKWDAGENCPTTLALPEVSKVMGVSIPRIIAALQNSKTQRQAQ